ncbi:hypothetical protein [Nostoc sp. UHCC 0870]|uniref:hypothetical protein n=1 Tax=Nostoc sp. UHCC 0870 TaxID=2914041 RepID=UPI001EDD8C17|nr:hypothetical protein [Nostoc sp. UHCC 0870]UKP01481.1 hypothetical protein L6494_30260 [Nostoc sp. UHCC 0870]
MTPNIITDLKAKTPEELKQLYFDAKEYDTWGEKTRRLVDLAEKHYGASQGVHLDCLCHTLYRFLAKRYIQSIQSSGCVGCEPGEVG